MYHVILPGGFADTKLPPPDSKPATPATSSVMAASAANPKKRRRDDTPQSRPRSPGKQGCTNSLSLLLGVLLSTRRAGARGSKKPLSAAKKGAHLLAVVMHPFFRLLTHPHMHSQEGGGDLLGPESKDLRASSLENPPDVKPSDGGEEALADGT